MPTRTVLSEAEVGRAIVRISHEIIEANQGSAGLVILGIPTRGIALAGRIAASIEGIEPGFSAKASTGSLNVGAHRDDARLDSNSPASVVPAGGVHEKTVILVDDVLYSGRTIRAALDALTALGRPRCVKLAVLVDRGHRELPIRADFVGKNLPTARQERVNVQLAEVDGVTQVVIES